MSSSVAARAVQATAPERRLQVAAIGKVERWSRSSTGAATFAAGWGRVSSSIILAGAGHAPGPGLTRVKGVRGSRLLAVAWRFVTAGGRMEDTLGRTIA
jgi:hypothetical protein